VISFVDASFLIALLYKKDSFHLRARQISQSLLDPRLFTSNVVIAEVVNYIYRTGGPEAAKTTLTLIKKTGIEEVYATKEIFDSAYNFLFRQKYKKGLNLFDCLHLATMKTLGIKTILTFDQGFKKEVKVIGLQ